MPHFDFTHYVLICRILTPPGLEPGSPEAIAATIHQVWYFDNLHLLSFNCYTFHTSVATESILKMIQVALDIDFSY